jgi:DNA-damage-inducible protein D
MQTKIQAEKGITIFEGNKIRKVWDSKKETWYFSLVDIVQTLTDSSNPTDYLKKLRKRDLELQSYIGTNCPQVEMLTDTGKFRKTLSGNIENCFRLIQSIPSPKAEPFKLWLAKVGQERIEEIQDPERAILRAKNIYTSKGYDNDWIAKRMRGINVRNTLTDEWKNRGAKEGLEFAILTNEIYKGAFEKTAKEIKDFKRLRNQDNPRDHMNELEIILTMLGEATTTEITKERDSKKLKDLQKDAKDGGQVAGNARKEIEEKTNKKVMGKDNFLGNKKQGKLK